MVTVDHDLRRGSGRSIPEAFAVHLGLSPGAPGELGSGDRTVRLGWGMSPTIGSLRWLVQEHGLVDGDQVFIRRATPSTLDFRIVRWAALETASGADLLGLLVGADNATPVERWLGDALGLGGAAAPSRANLRARLEARGEAELATLLDAI